LLFLPNLIYQIEAVGVVCVDRGVVAVVVVDLVVGVVHVVRLRLIAGHLERVLKVGFRDSICSFSFHWTEKIQAQL
jgi:hypothetical protein